MAVTVARLEAILSATRGDFDRSMRQSESRLKRVGGAAKLMGVPLPAQLVVELKRAVDAAIDAERSQARLETAFKDASVAIGPYGKSIEKASTAAINLGFDDEALKDSIGSLIIATGDYKKAQEATNVAMDLARFKGIDLEAGNEDADDGDGRLQRAMKQLGIVRLSATTEYDRLKAKFTSATSAGGKHITMCEELALQDSEAEDKQATAAQEIDIVREKVRGRPRRTRRRRRGRWRFSARRSRSSRRS